MSTNVAGKTAAVRIATGTYTGDGTVSHAITGLGFRPKYVRIWRHNAEAAGTWNYIFERTDTYAGDLCHRISTAGTNAALMEVVGDCLISLDADGFTVDDGGIDDQPNTDGQLYDYLALG